MGEFASRLHRTGTLSCSADVQEIRGENSDTSEISIELIIMIDDWAAGERDVYVVEEEEKNGIADQVIPKTTY